MNGNTVSNIAYQHLETQDEAVVGNQTNSASHSENECAICLSKIHPSDESDLNCHFYHKACLNKVLTTAPNNMRCPLCRKNINLLTEPLDTQISFLENLIKKEPTNAKWHNNLGLSKIKLDRSVSKEAVMHLTRAVEIEPTNAKSWLNLANKWPESQRLMLIFDRTNEPSKEPIFYTRLQAYEKVRQLDKSLTSAKVWIDHLMNLDQSKPADQSIHFYRVDEDYGEFSNFAPFPISINGQIWPTSEHFYQAQKFVEPEVIEQVRTAKRPADAALLGRTLKLQRIADWGLRKEGVMKQALEEKFKQHSMLRSLLLSTGEKRLVEHTGNDHYWADGGDGSGKNRLGILLTELRNEMRSKPSGKRIANTVGDYLTSKHRIVIRDKIQQLKVWKRDLQMGMSERLKFSDSDMKRLIKNLLKSPTLNEQFQLSGVDALTDQQLHEKIGNCLNGAYDALSVNALPIAELKSIINAKLMILQLEQKITTVEAMLNSATRFASNVAGHSIT